ncbi:MAG: hypothetical protein NWE99_06550 [Candidatus Bathyarchaeota archaeon]|nr:hypothetical protein [Candidatus Bathyarchaeota archaeon]
MLRNNLKPSLIAVVVAAIWISIILFYTRGGLLVGGDTPGYYDAITDIRTGYPHEMIYGISLLLASGNVYAGFYLGTFMGLCLNLLALSYFLTTFFSETQGKLYALTIANVFFVFSMFSVYNTFKSVISVASISAGGFLLFLAQGVKLYRYMKMGTKFTKLDCLLMGAGIAVSSMLPPNSFRVLAVEGAIVIGLMLLASVKQTASKASSIKLVLKRFILTTPLIIIVAMIGMLYWEWYFFSSLTANIETSLYAAQSLGLYTLHAPYANLINTFRIFGVWAFQTGYCPYHDLYFSNPVITITSFMWPIIALGMSLLLVKKCHRLKILLLVISALLIIAWDTADNPPVGIINLTIGSYVPILLSFFQTFFLSGLLLPIIYVTLSTYVVLRVIELLHTSKTKTHRLFHKLTAAMIPVFLIVILLIPNAPFFTGHALGQYFNPDIKGIWIPKDYFETKNILLSSMKMEHNALLWPSISTYVQTAWYYQGSNSFYNYFFSPLPVYTPDTLGGYSLAHPELAMEYSNITSVPLKAGDSIDITNYVACVKMYVQGSCYTYSNGMVEIDLSKNASDYIDVVIPFHDAFNASNVLLFTIQFSAGSDVFIKDIIENRRMWVGVGSGGIVGWYLLGSSASSTYNLSDNGTVLISMNVGSPDKPWVSSTYDSSYVTSFILRIFIQGYPKNSHEYLTLSSFSIKAFSYDINNVVLNLWQKYKIDYVIFDRSIISGATRAIEQYAVASSFLVNDDVLIPIFVGEYVQLYRVNYGAV